MYKKIGVDISSHNGNVDFKNLKDNGVDFVILRVGYSTTKDKLFEKNYANAKKIGLHVGAYLYSYATTVKEANKEMEFVHNILKNKQLDYPIYLDMEDTDNYKQKHNVSVKTIQDITRTFCTALEKKGYYVGLYASESWFKNQLKPFNNNRFDMWIANWGKDTGIITVDKSKTHRLHQFTSNFCIKNKKFDGNISYYNYPEVIKRKRKNGY